MNQAVRCAIHGEHAILQAIQARARAHPQRTRAILEERQHRVVREAARCLRVGRESSVSVAKSQATAPSAYPQTALPICQERPDALGWQAVLDAVCRKHPLRVADQAAAGHADPEAAFGVLGDGHDAIARKTLCPTERGQLSRLQPIQPAGVRANPEVPFAILEKGMDVVVRQTVILGEGDERTTLRRWRVHLVTRLAQ
jgi:hypothetical protein